MATVRVSIDASAAGEGARQFTRATVSLKTGAGAAARSVQQVDGAFERLRKRLLSIQSLVATLGLRGLIDLADSYKLLETRLKLVTDSSAEFAEVQERLFEIAQETRASFTATNDLYVRLARSTAGLGRSQEELLRLTETVNKAIVVSGTRGSEASAALMRFAQSLASGAVGADELQGILSRVPRLAQAIADGLGRTTDELLELAAQGRLSAEAVAAAILSQADLIDREFQQIPATVGQAFTKLSNEVFRYLGLADKSTSASAALADGVSALADNFSKLARAIQAATAAGITFVALNLPLSLGLLRRIIGSIGTVLGTLAGALRKNPFALIATAAAAAVGALVFFRDKLVTIGDRAVEVRDVVAGAFSVMKDRITVAADAVGERLGSVREAIVSRFKDELIALGDLVAAVFGRIIDTALFTLDKISAFGASVVEIVLLAFRKLEDPESVRFFEEAGAIVGRNFATSFTAQAAEQIGSFFGGLFDEILAEAERHRFTRVATAAARVPKPDLSTTTVVAARSQAIVVAEADRQRAIRAAEATIAALEREVVALGAGRAAYDEYQRARRIISNVEQFRATLEATKVEEDQVRALADRYEELAVAKDMALARLTAQEEEARRVQQAVRDLGNVFVSAFEDAVVEGKTLSDILRGLEKDIIRIILRLTVTQPLQGFLTGIFGSGGFDLGGLLGGSSGAGGAGGGKTLIPGTGIFDFHEGGLVGSANVAERVVPAALLTNAPRFQFGLAPDEFPAVLHRGEAVIPLKSGKVPVEIKERRESQRPVIINVHVTTPDAGSFRNNENQIAAQLARAADRAKARLL
jgi:tape measure domain-containing protein